MHIRISCKCLECWRPYCIWVMFASQALTQHVYNPRTTWKMAIWNITKKRILEGIYLAFFYSVFLSKQIMACSCSGRQPDQLTANASLNRAAHLLDVDANEIAKSFLTRTISAGPGIHTCNIDEKWYQLSNLMKGETLVTPLSREKAENSRDSLAMLLYSKLFDWFVKHLSFILILPFKCAAKHVPVCW